MSVQAELLSEIESFLAQHGGMAETTFGRLAVNDGKFVRRLRDGSNMTLGTIDRVQKFLRDHGKAGASPPPDATSPSAPVTPKPKTKRSAPAAAKPAQAAKPAPTPKSEPKQSAEPQQRQDRAA